MQIRLFAPVSLLLQYNRKATGHTALYIGLFILSVTAAISQPRPGPCFESNITRGCVPLTVTLSNCSTDGSQIGYDYGNGVFTNNQTFTYTTPGLYTIKQIGNFESSNGGDTLTRVNYIEVLATPPPSFVLSTCQGRTVEVNITDTSYDSYVVNYGDGTTQTTTSNTAVRRTYPDLSPRTITVTGQHITKPANQPCAGNSSSQTITPIQGLLKPVWNNLQATGTTSLELSFQTNNFLNYRLYQKTGTTGAYQEIAAINHPQGNTLRQAVANVDITAQIYSFQVAAVDVCGNQLLSDEISTVTLNTTASNNQNNLSWQIHTSPLIQKFIIYRNGQVLTEITDVNRRTYSDAAVRCPNEYCYQVVAQYSNGAQSVSVQSCVRAVSTDKPLAIQHLTASVQNNFAFLSWQAPDAEVAQEYIIYRSDNGREFRELDRTSNTTYLDNRNNPITPSNTYCYRLVYTNTCGNTSAESILACPMLLTKSSADDTPQLNWTAYREWPGGVKEYVVEKLDEQGNVYETQQAGNILSLPFNSQLIDTTRQVLRFRVKAIPVNNILGPALSNIIELTQPVQIHLPTAFTPDGNTTNDVFTAKGLFINEFTLWVYNRWGEIVFQSDSMQEGWDGKYRNEEAPAGRYAYSIRVRDATGGIHTRDGTVFLIR